MLLYGTMARQIISPPLRTIEEKLFNIFIPISLVHSNSGWLVGYWVSTPNPVVYILAVLHGPNPASNYLERKCQLKRVDFMPSVIGELWNQDIQEDRIKTRTASNLLQQVSVLYLSLKIRNCQLLLDKVAFQQESVAVPTNCTLYFYNPDCILKSKLLNIKKEGELSYTPAEFQKLNFLDKLLLVLHSWQEFKFGNVKDISNAISSDEGNGNYHKSARKNKSVDDKILNFILRMLLLSSFLCQCRQRFQQLCFVLTPSQSKQHLRACLRCQNTLTSILLDILIGSLLLHLLLQWMNIGELFDLFVYSAEFVVDRLQNLIKWLMGIPAGLKLNFPLSSALGHFFLYHIYLWQTYIIVVKPFLQYLMELIPALGWMGLTFQLSLLTDLISLATFHIYCFYVYATRLYHLHVCALISLWRLVRGRKWNPLRHRVDSCNYNVDQLFVGSLLFMILLFLFPTTLLFYSVFCILRLWIVSIVGILSRTVFCLSTIPSFAMLLHFGNSQLVTGDIRMSVQATTKMSQPLMLKLEVFPSSLTKVWNSTLPLNFIERDYMSWSVFLRDLLLGNLVYPI